MKLSQNLKLVQKELDTVFYSANFMDANPIITIDPNEIYSISLLEDDLPVNGFTKEGNAIILNMKRYYSLLASGKLKETIALEKLKR